MSTLRHHAELLVALLVVSWFVIVGGIGAAIAGVRGGRPLLGFLVAAAIPIPGLGWLVVRLVTAGSPVPGSPADTPEDNGEQFLGKGW